MSGQRVFSGQLYQADPETKAWSMMCKGLVTLTLLPVGNKRWKIVASKGAEKVFEREMGLTFKHRVKDTFVQWQQKSSSGGSETHGFRTKEDATAQELGKVLDSIMSEFGQKVSLCVNDDKVLLTIILPNQNKSTMKFIKSATMVQVLKTVAERYQLDPAQYALACPPETAGGNPSMLKPTMIAAQVKGVDVVVVSRKKSMKVSQEETITLEVFLPDDTTNTIHVNPTVSLKELLILVCSKFSLDSSAHVFDLPIANPPDSLKLQQLKISSIKLIQKDILSGANALKGKKISKSSEPMDIQRDLTPRKTVAPPPPKPSEQKQAEHDLVQQLKSTTTLLSEAHKDKTGVGENMEEVDSPSLSKSSLEHVTPSSETKKPAEKISPGMHKSHTVRKAPPPPLQKSSPQVPAAPASTLANNTKHTKKGTIARQAPPPPKPVQVKQKPTESTASKTQAAVNKEKPYSPNVIMSRDTSLHHKRSSPKVSPLVTRRMMASDVTQLPAHHVQASPSSSPSKITQMSRAPGKPAPKPPSCRKRADKEIEQHNQPAKVSISPSKDGGQVMIVRSSPSERRKVVSLPASLVFKLPPPPPKGADFYSLKKTKKEEAEPRSEDVTATKHLIVNETGKYKEEIELLSTTIADKEKQDEANEEEKEEKEKELYVHNKEEAREESSDEADDKNDTDLDKSTTTSESDSVLGYQVDSATMLHKEDFEENHAVLPSQVNEPMDVQIDGDTLFDQVSPVWQRPSVATGTFSFADSQSGSEDSDDEEDYGNGEDESGIVLLSVQKTDEITAEPTEMTKTDMEVDIAELDFNMSPSFAEAPPSKVDTKPTEPTDPVFQIALDQLSNLSVAEAIAKEEQTQREKNTEDLNELDTMITSLRSLIADTCELGGKIDGAQSNLNEGKSDRVQKSKSTMSDTALPASCTTSKLANKPSPHENYVSVAGDHPCSAAVALRRPSPPPSPPSPPSSPPPPPPLSPPPLDDELEPEIQKPNSNTPPQTKPKPSRKPVTGESELLAKLKQRREKSDTSYTLTTNDEKPSAPQQVPPGSSSLHSGSGSLSGMVQSGDGVQMQLQLLQQQVLQQQVMQLQQQFQNFMSSGMPQQQQQQQMLNFMQQMQQMQASMVQPPLAGYQASMVQPPLAGYPPSGMMHGQPLGSLPQQQVPMVQPVMGSHIQPPFAMATPPLSSSTNQQLPIMSTGIVPIPSASYNHSVSTANLGITQGVAEHPGQPSVQPQPSITQLAPHAMSLAPATGEQQLPPGLAPTPSQSERKTSEAKMRSDIMGSAVKRYDNLMQQVKAVDFSEILKSPDDDDDEDEETHSSYTGMTAALLAAMQERRKQIQSETSFDNNAETILGQDSHYNDDDDSNSWDP